MGNGRVTTARDPLAADPPYLSCNRAVICRQGGGNAAGGFEERWEDP
jgi:hypothetical protein